MFRFHTILADYTPLVKAYVLDARPLPSGRPLVQLTVLVHPETSGMLIQQIYHRLNFQMSGNPELVEIAANFGIEAPGRVTVFTCLVKRLETPQ